MIINENKTENIFFFKILKSNISCHNEHISCNLKKDIEKFNQNISTMKIPNEIKSE